MVSFLLNFALLIQVSSISASGLHSRHTLSRLMFLGPAKHGELDFDVGLGVYDYAVVSPVGRAS